LYLGVIFGGMAVIKKDLGGMRVRINVLGGMVVICCYIKDKLYSLYKGFKRSL
jgi:hypothetical protein